MPPKGSRLANTWTRMPTMSNVPRKRAFDELSNQYVTNRIGLSTNWRDHPEMLYNRHWMRNEISQLIMIDINKEKAATRMECMIYFIKYGIDIEKIATVLEWKLFLSAASKEAYMNHETLNQRVDALMADAISFAIAHYCVPPSSDHELPPFPESISTFADTDVPYNVTISGGGSYSPQPHANNLEEMDHTKSNNFPDLWSLIDFSEYLPQNLDLQKNFTDDGNTEAMLPHSKRQKMESGCDVSLVKDASYDEPIDEMVPSKGLEAAGQISVGIDSMPTLKKDVIIIDNDDEEEGTEAQKISEENVIIIDDDDDDAEEEGTDAQKISEENDLERHGMTDSNNSDMHAFISIDVEDKQDRIEFNQEGTDAQKISEESDLERHGMADSNNSMDIDIGAVPIDVEEKQDSIEFNQEGTDAQKKISEPKANQEKKTNDVVSLIDFFTRDQITEHIRSLKKGSVQSSTAGDDNTCQLCAMKDLAFTPVQIFCSSCSKSIKRNANYYCRKGEEFDPECCFCSNCYKNNNSKGRCITFNGTSISKTLLEQKTNNEVLEEPWVECDKCKRWQHQICALFNNKTDLEYICPLCRLKEIENGMHVPLPKTAVFDAKELPKTVLSDHLEKRLFERLMQERAERQKIEGNETLDEDVVAESLSVREVLSVDKQLTVKKQFLDIIPEENYPSEFSYRSRAILLFQKIEGADVCIFAMYVQEFGSECGNPNQRCVYISYLDSVKHFTPRRQTTSGEALRTFVYHEILIGYLDFCKKRGFATCYIWACAPKEGDDYILYCHPKNQKTPKDDKLREWYLSMLTKATKENVVVGLTNLYDHLFVSTERRYSKVTTARLPYFDGDIWSTTAMAKAENIEKECGGEYGNTLKKVVKTRSLKAMGYVNPPKGNAKDILVMHKLGEVILPMKKNFIVAHLQYSCMHCCEPIVSGKRWFCTKCKKYQECERCHTADVHTSIKDEVHTLSQALVDDIPFNTAQNDIIFENGLFENRSNFLSFCQTNQFQFDTPRHAKYSSMMILYHLKNTFLPTV